MSIPEFGDGPPPKLQDISIPGLPFILPSITTGSYILYPAQLFMINDEENFITSLPILSLAILKASPKVHTSVPSHLGSGLKVCPDDSEFTRKVLVLLLSKTPTSTYVGTLSYAPSFTLS